MSNTVIIDKKYIKKEFKEMGGTSSVYLVEEIIIVDTGSTDKTKDIAYRYTNKVYDFEWVNDFSKARNYAFSKATKDYQMWLDADDVITKDDGDRIRILKRDLDSSDDIVTFKYYTHFDQYGTPMLTSTRGRLFKREKNYKWNDPVHEYIELSGNIFYANDIYVSHKKQASYTDRNLKIYQELVEKGHKLSPRGMYYFARELKDHQRYGWATYYFEEFLESGLGWSEDNISACFNLSICYLKLNNNRKILPILLKMHDLMYGHSVMVQLQKRKILFIHMLRLVHIMFS